MQVADTRLADEDSAYFAEAPLVYSNRTAWYPRPGTEDFSPSTVRFDVPAGWLAVTGGEQRGLRTEERRTLSEYRLEQPGKFITAVVGRLTDVGLRQLDAQAVRGYATPRTRSQTIEQMALAEEILAFYSRLFGPCPYPSLGLVLAEARTPGGHSPPGLVYLQERPAMLRAPAAEDPANFSRPARLSSSPTSWRTSGGARARLRPATASAGCPRPGPSTRRRCGCGERQGEAAFRDMLDRMARWAFRYDAAGPIHLGQRLGTSRGTRAIFRAVVYDKGAWVLHMLRGIVGDEAFFKGARAFLERRRFASATLGRPARGARGRERTRPAPVLRAAGSRTPACRGCAGAPPRRLSRAAFERRSRCAPKACPARCRC